MLALLTYIKFWNQLKCPSIVSINLYGIFMFNGILHSNSHELLHKSRSLMHLSNKELGAKEKFKINKFQTNLFH